jgi:phage shock protein A
LLDTGALPDALGGGGDDIQRELDATSQQSQVDSELAALKSQVRTGASEPGQLPAADAPGGATEPAGEGTTAPEDGSAS